MGKNKAQKKAAYKQREEKNAKKVLVNLIIGLVVIAGLIIAFSTLV